MGTIQHHAIIITSWEQKRAEEFRARAVEIAHGVRGKTFAEMVSPVILSAANGYATVFIAPDGSKEGWACSEDGDNFRDALIAAAEEMSLDWAEVGFGEIGYSLRASGLDTPILVG